MTPQVAPGEGLLLLYLEGLVSDEGEEGNSSVSVAPGSGHTGSSQKLSVFESNAHLQSHIRWRLPGRPTTARQGYVEPERFVFVNEHGDIFTGSDSD